jgi:predicted metal-dependent hydrolase
MAQKRINGHDILAGMSDLLPCAASLPEKAWQGIAAFNRRQFYEAHDFLEEAWQAEPGEIRDLYRGILQVTVCYFHITRQNYEGALKMYARSQKWLVKWQPGCRGVRVTELLSDAEQTIQALQKLGPEKIGSFSPDLFKPIVVDRV